MDPMELSVIVAPGSGPESVAHASHSQAVHAVDHSFDSSRCTASETSSDEWKDRLVRESWSPAGHGRKLCPLVAGSSLCRFPDRPLPPAGSPYASTLERESPCRNVATRSGAGPYMLIV